MTAKFWWSQGNKERGIHWVSWQKLQKRKTEGGLGFKNLHAMNIALLGKQVWRLHQEPDALWARLLKSLYYPSCSVWEAKTGRNASWAWRSISKASEFVNRHKTWAIKDGNQIRVYKDK